MDAGEQRAQGAVFRGPAAQDYFLPRAAFGFGPAAGAARAVGRIESLRHDALESHFARRGEHRLCVRLQMGDVTNAIADAAGRQQFLEAGLAFHQRQRTQVLASLEQQIKRKENEVLGFLLRQRGLQRGEAWQATLIQRHDFTVDHAVRQRVGVSCDGGEAVGPVKTGAGADDRAAVLHVELRAIAVEFDLVCPSGILRWPIHQRAELRFDELRHLPHDNRLDARGFGLRSSSRSARLAWIRAGRAAPHRVRPRLLRRREHEGFGSFAGAVADLPQVFEKSRLVL